MKTFEFLSNAFKNTVPTFITMSIVRNRFIWRTCKNLFLYFSLLFLLASCGELFTFSIHKPYFWKAEKEGKTSYLLGTMHYGISLEELPCSDTILKELKESDLVLTELGDTRDKKRQKERVEALYLSYNSTDFKQLSPESQRFLTQKGIKNHLSFLAISLLLDQACVEDAVGRESASVSMDEQVETIAQSQNIPLQALDTTELRKPMKNLFTKESVENQIANYYLCPKAIQYSIGLYKRGYLEPDSHLIDTTNEFDRWALKHRNESWFAQFKSVHDDYDRIFVAAGKLHFTGAFNLIGMLQQEGFHTERVSCVEPF